MIPLGCILCSPNAFPNGCQTAFCNQNLKSIPMDSQAINEALQNIGLNLAAAAEAIGCTRSTLSNVVARRTGSRHVALSLALLLGRDVREVFPDVPRYAKPSRSEAHQAMVETARQRLADASHQSVKSA